MVELSRPSVRQGPPGGSAYACCGVFGPTLKPQRALKYSAGAFSLGRKFVGKCSRRGAVLFPGVESRFWRWHHRWRRDIDGRKRAIGVSVLALRGRARANLHGSAKAIAKRLPFHALFVVLVGLAACSCSKPAAPAPSFASSGNESAPGAPTIRGAGLVHGLRLRYCGHVRTTWVGRYAAFLAVSRSGLVVKNLAVPGFSTFQVLPTDSSHRWRKPDVDPAHNVTRALAEHPVAIIVNLPSNDAAMGVDVDDTMDNLRAVVAKAKEAGVPTWVTTSQPRALDAAGILLLEKLREAVLRDFKDRSLNFWSPLAAPDGTPLSTLNQGDGIHPNAEGHRLLFEVVKTADIPGHLGYRAPRDQ